MSVDRKMEELQERLEKRVKPQERGKFVSEETFSLLARQEEQLSRLPESLNASVAQTYTAITANLNRMTITREDPSLLTLELGVVVLPLKLKFSPLVGV